MKTYMHGGDIYSKNGIIYDFSANINPLGPPDRVKTAIINSTENIVNYPDPYCRDLVSAIAEYEAIPEPSIVCGNGVADLLFRLTRAYAKKQACLKALIPAPSFSEYEVAVKEAGGSLVYHRLDKAEGFELGTSILQSIEDASLEGVNLVFLCNPNNPTGLTIDIELLDEIIDLACQEKILLVLDECFIDLTDDGEKRTRLARASESDNLLVLKAFTKTFAMPGLRLGYAVSGKRDLMDDLFMTGQPWSVNSLAQAAGIAALKERGYVDRSRDYIGRERAKLKQALRENGAELTYGTANYIFFKMEDGRAFYEYMKSRGFLVRTCANFVGLDDDYLRIAVRSSRENDAFIQALKTGRGAKNVEG